MESRFDDIEASSADLQSWEDWDEGLSPEKLADLKGQLSKHLSLLRLWGDLVAKVKGLVDHGEG